MYQPFEIDIGGVKLKDQSYGFARDGLYIDWDTGIDGWFETPSAKVSLTERGQGDGAFAISDTAVLYAARTVSIGILATGGTSDAVGALRNALLSLTSRIVRLTVRDGLEETFADGYITLKWENSRLDHMQHGTMTFVAADPRRYSTTEHKANLSAGVLSSGGLQYDIGQRLIWPLNYGEQPKQGNIGTVSNRGTTTAYPTITLSGDLDARATITGNNCDLVYTQPVFFGSPVVFDCFNHMATCNGVDVTRSLSMRDFPSIKPGESLTCVLNAAGKGGATVSVRDTYI